VDDTGTKLLENISAKFEIGQTTAIVGGLNSGGETLADVLARLLPNSTGNIKLENSDLEDQPEFRTGRRVGYVPAEVSLFFGSFGDNLLYGLKNAPFRSREYDGERKKQRDWDISEARQAGNTDLDINADWINYDAVGAKDQAGLIFKIMETLDVVGLSSDVMNFGLRGTVDPAERPDLAEKILAARLELKSRLAKDPYAGMVELFDPESYTRQATVAENLFFGTAVGDELDVSHPYLASVLESQNLFESLYAMGHEMAATAIELFADLDPGHPFFQQLSFMTAEEMPDYQLAINRLKDVPFADVSKADRQMFIRLTFGYIEPRHRLGLLDDDMRERLLKARQAFRVGLPDDLHDAIEFYDPESYNCASSVQDNILFGRIAYGVAEGETTILGMLRDVLQEHQLRDEVFTVGLEFDVGSGGKRLTSAQRQKLGLGRALLKNPDFLIVNRAMAALDRPSQKVIISDVLKRASQAEKSIGVLWVLASPSIAKKFDRVLVMDSGRLVEDGKPQELLTKAGKFAELVA
jgi:putative ABC transport system ATP-binding protein